MAVTVAQLIQDTLRELNEATGSSLGVVGDGAGTDTVSTTTTLYNYITQAVVDWCETAWPLPGSATLATWPTGVRTKMLHDLTLPSGQGRLFAITALALGATPAALTRISIEELRGEYPNFEFATNGTPLYYYQTPSYVGLYPAPSTDKVLTAYGYCVPVKAGASDGAAITTSYSFAPDDVLLRVIPPKAAILLAEKTFDDPSVYGRLDHLRARYALDQAEMRSKLSPDVLEHLKMPQMTGRK